MAEKKSFVMYADWENIIEVLDEADCGRLLRAVFAYFSRGEQPDFGGALKAVFIMIAQQLDRDREKWEKVCERNRKNGAKGGRPSTKPTGFSGNPNEPKKPDTDNDTVNDTDIDIVNETENENDTVIETENVNESESESVTETEQSSCAYAPPAPAPAQTNTNNNIFISEEAKRFLCDKYGSALVDEYLTRVRDYCKNTGKRYSDPASTIAKWIEQDKAKGFIPAKKPGYEPYCSEQPSYDIDEWYRTADARVDAYMESLGIS